MGDRDPRQSLGIGVVIAIGTGMFLAGCVGGCTFGVITSSDSSSDQRSSPSASRASDAIPRISPVPMTPPVDPVAGLPACYPAPAELVDSINQTFTGGEYLDHAQVVDGPEQTTYVGGNIFDSAGQKVSSQDTWVDIEGLIFSITSDARSRTLAPDGRDLAGVYMHWPEYNTVVSECVGAVERAANSGG